MSTAAPRVALLHDWLLGMRGGERCLEVLVDLFPEADIYTLFHRPNSVVPSIEARLRGVSRLGRLPGVGAYYRHLLPIYGLGTRDLSRQLAQQHYDLVISVSHCVAKNVAVPPGAIHLCYCLTPMRYIWDKYDDYFADHWGEPAIRRLVEPLRAADREGAAGVHRFVAISDFVRARIQRLYGVDADVIYPPVRTDWISPRVSGERGSGFLVVNALVPYKNTDLIVDAFNTLGYPLTIVGRGPEERELRRRARSNIRFIPAASDEQLAALYRSADALVFAAEEDFGMTPVEALAAGRPVICYARGGVLETVPPRVKDPVGVHFSELSPEAICEAVEQFVHRQDEFTVDNCTSQAEVFSLTRFVSELSSVLTQLGFVGAIADDAVSLRRSITGGAVQGRSVNAGGM